MNTNRWMWGSLLLVFLTIICVAAARPLIPSRSDSFTSVAKRAQKAVIRGDWRALQQDAEPEIYFAQYMRGYSQDLTQEQIRLLWPDLFSPELKPREADFGDASPYGVVNELASMNRPLRPSARKHFKRFCDIVKNSWTTERGLNEMSLRNQGAEVPEIIGPAVSGTYASNVHWRIELSRNTGRWRVNRLVVEMH